MNDDQNKSVSVMAVFNSLQSSAKGANIADSTLYTLAQRLVEDNKVIVDADRHQEGEVLIKNRDDLRRVML